MSIYNRNALFAPVRRPEPDRELIALCAEAVHAYRHVINIEKGGDPREVDAERARLCGLLRLVETTTACTTPARLLRSRVLGSNASC